MTKETVMKVIAKGAVLQMNFEIGADMVVVVLVVVLVVKMIMFVRRTIIKASTKMRKTVSTKSILNAEMITPYILKTVWT